MSIDPWTIIGWVVVACLCVGAFKMAREYVLDALEWARQRWALRQARIGKRQCDARKRGPAPRERCPNTALFGSGSPSNVYGFWCEEHRPSFHTFRLRQW